MKKDSLFATEPYLDDVRLRRLWPPYHYAMNAQLLVLLPRTALAREESVWTQALAEEDWFRDVDVACLILGEAVLRPDGNYHPQDFYAVADVLALTQLYRRPQQEQERRAAEATRRILENRKVQQLRDEQWKRAADAERLEAQRRAAMRSTDPIKEIEAMKQRLAQLEDERRSVTVAPPSGG
jgi:hypothetical protein